jgi:hypothetical protein
MQKARVGTLYLGDANGQLGTEVTLTPANMNLAVTGVAAGYKVARGTVSATASAAITTGLTTILGFALSVNGATATLINAAPALSGSISGGTLTVYRWKHTGPSTATLVAATTGGSVAWVAVGT